MVVPSNDMARDGESKGWGVGRWIGCGCGGCLLVIVLIVGFFAAVGGLAFFGIKKSDVYQEALRRAQESPAVVEALGEPITTGVLVSGSISVTGPSGTAELAIPISGPDGAGTIYATATKSEGQWEFSVLEVNIDATGERIDLLGDVVEEVELARTA